MRYRDLFEKYTAHNSHLLRYFNDAEFDPFTYWSELRLWFEENEEYIEMLSEITGQQFDDADAINEEEPDIFYQLPQEVQKEAAEWVTEWLLQHDPSDAPTYSQVGLQQNRLIPRNSWLLHFTNEPDAIAEQGFTIGTHDMNKLALTTFKSNTSFDKQFGGYNFAFLAGSRDARYAESENKYGKHPVMFQNSGVMTYHYADEEQQVIFRGEDIDPRDMVVLHQYDEWSVMARRPTRRSSYTSKLFTSDFETCVSWVMTHFDQYRRYLTRR
jgi:hypothetical protein